MANSHLDPRNPTQPQGVREVGGLTDMKHVSDPVSLVAEQGTMRQGTTSPLEEKELRSQKAQRLNMEVHVAAV